MAIDSSQQEPVAVESVAFPSARPAGLSSPLAQRWRRALALAASALLGVVYARWNSRVQLAEAEMMARGLSELTRSAQSVDDTLSVSPDVANPPPEAFEDEESETASAAGVRARTPGSKARKSQEKPAGDVHVPATVVLKLANARAMPAAAFVATDGVRPPGLRLLGVSRLGLGVRDGDVLTDVNGAPVTSVATVVSIVLKQRVQHAPAVQGTLWRGKSSYRVTVEMPYPTPPSASNSANAPNVPLAPTK